MVGWNGLSSTAARPTGRRSLPATVKAGYKDKRGTPSLRCYRLPSRSKFSLPEQFRLRANSPRDEFATEPSRQLGRFHVAVLHRRRKKSVHYCVRNALGTAIVKLIDATEGGTELAYKHFTQQASGVVQTCLYRLRCECRQLGKLPPASCRRQRSPRTRYAAHRATHLSTVPGCLGSRRRSSSTPGATPCYNPRSAALSEPNPSNGAFHGIFPSWQRPFSTYFLFIVRSRNSCINDPIRSTSSSNAKWPVSRRWSSALGISLLKSSAPSTVKIPSFLPHVISVGG
jgi:hypothetical protein